MLGLDERIDNSTSEAAAEKEFIAVYGSIKSGKYAGIKGQLQQSPNLPAFVSQSWRARTYVEISTFDLLVIAWKERAMLYSMWYAERKPCQ